MTLADDGHLRRPRQPSDIYVVDVFALDFDQVVLTVQMPQSRYAEDRK